MQKKALKTNQRDVLTAEEQENNKKEASKEDKGEFTSPFLF
jgi:hypothetical protein